MRLHRFFIDSTIGTAKETTITSPLLLHQWRKVFRFAPGNNVIVFDNSGYEYTAEINYLNDKEAKLSITETKENIVKQKHTITLFASLVKKDTFEWILEKGTELGVSRFVPLLSDRSEKKNINTERAQKILIEATEQSGRFIIPELMPIIKLEDAIKENAALASIAWDPQGSLYSEATTKKEIDNNETLGVYIGPEGGWSPREIEMFSQNKIPVVSLGNFTLRAETAALATLSLLLL